MSKIEDIPFVDINLSIYKYLGMLFPTNTNSWRKYAFVLFVCVINFMQFCYIIRMWGDMTSVIFNFFFFSAIFVGILRTFLVIVKRKEFESFLEMLATLYWEVQASNDRHSKRILTETAIEASCIAIVNLSVSFIDVVTALLLPLLSDQRVQPFGVHIPMMDVTKSPVYEILYIMQLPTPLIFSMVYMPFVSMFAAFALFAKALLQILAYKLSLVGKLRTEEERTYWLKKCIAYHNKIGSYIHKLNALVSNLLGIEAFIFGGNICTLLYCLKTVQTITKKLFIVMHILTMLYVMLTYYKRANDIIVESKAVSNAVYDVPWYEGSIRFRKTIHIFLMQAQAPFKICIFGTTVMTLVSFQRILTTSYKIFFLLLALAKGKHVVEVRRMRRAQH